MYSNFYQSGDLSNLVPKTAARWHFSSKLYQQVALYAKLYHQVALEFQIQQHLKPNYLRNKVLCHPFYLPKVIIQVQNGNGVLNRLVSYLKCMELACWVLQASLELYYFNTNDYKLLFMISTKQDIWVREEKIPRSFQKKGLNPRAMMTKNFAS